MGLARTKRDLTLLGKVLHTFLRAQLMCQTIIHGKQVNLIVASEQQIGCRPYTRSASTFLKVKVHARPFKINLSYAQCGVLDLQPRVN